MLITKPEYKYVIVSTDDESLEELNNDLARGWEPVRETPMGGGGEALSRSSLVLLQQFPKVPHGGH